jgi:hypothetical protein
MLAIAEPSERFMLVCISLGAADRKAARDSDNLSQLC